MNGNMDTTITTPATHIQYHTSSNTYIKHHTTKHYTYSATHANKILFFGNRHAALHIHICNKTNTILCIKQYTDTTTYTSDMRAISHTQQCP